MELVKEVEIENESEIMDEAIIKKDRTRRAKNKSYTNEELINFIKEFYNENKRVPIGKDFDLNPKYPSYGAYRNRFGTWNNAIKMAGLEVNSRDYATDELLESLRRFSIENNRVPKAIDFIGNQSYPSHSLIVRQFGSWNKGLIAAGLDVNVEHREIHVLSDEELIDYLKRYYSKNNKIPTVKDFENDTSYPSYMTYFSRFGSWNEALKIAGMEVNQEYRRFTDEELLDFLVNHFEKSGQIPTEKDFNNNPEYPSASVYRNRFGNWLKALELVDLGFDGAIEKGILQYSSHKGRLFERYVRDSFKNESKDLSGSNCKSPFDGVCPKGKSYDAKSSSLQTNGNWRGWYYYFKNKKFVLIEYFYIGAFNEDYSKLLHVWLIPNSFIKGHGLHIGMYGGEHTLDNMKEYEINDKCNFSMFK